MPLRCTCPKLTCAGWPRLCRSLIAVSASICRTVRSTHHAWRHGRRQTTSLLGTTTRESRMGHARSSRSACPGTAWTPGGPGRSRIPREPAQRPQGSGCAASCRLFLHSGSGVNTSSYIQCCTLWCRAVLPCYTEKVLRMQHQKTSSKDGRPQQPQLADARTSGTRLSSLKLLL